MAQAIVRSWKVWNQGFAGGSSVIPGCGETTIWTMDHALEQMCEECAATTPTVTLPTRIRAVEEEVYFFFDSRNAPFYTRWPASLKHQAACHPSSGFPASLVEL
ncbi:hypothetical protein FIBSPDRAFT_969159 [Athelia psychrophila]|uniref:Uncharacterized protein n=1 Tax=Athelia psychrophila TaxID=1759441 RepID=A0A167TTG8_9AGAM|nr:hypothetical protein FIBSPDRAFT_969159 [Fibularhizoctonia sp. CBS 109695]